jgi:hypothetical protein
MNQVNEVKKNASNYKDHTKQPKWLWRKLQIISNLDSANKGGEKKASK